MSKFLTTDALVFLTSQLFAFYVLSLVLMLRTSLPPSNRRLLNQILAHQEFEFYQKWHDGLFVLAVGLTGAFFAFERHLQKVQDKERKRWED